VKVLVTGAAGFIGYHAAEALLARGDEVIGLDNLNDYYDVALKEARAARLERSSGFRLVRTDLADRDAVARLFADEHPARVVHLGAQAGVRYSIDHPYSYIDSNIVGFLNILEGCRHHHIEHLVYASSSSVYGANSGMPYAVDQNVDHPLNLYGATKKANELMAHSYAHLYRLPTTGLRFFTVYGPWGRPDMALFTFTRRILAGEPIDVFNQGAHARDFTYIDDVVEGVVRTLDGVATSNPAWDSSNPDPASSSAPYRVYNIGNSQPVELLEYIRLLEEATGRKAALDLQPMQPGDVVATAADTRALKAAVGFRPRTPLDEGIRRYVTWHRAYYGARSASPVNGASSSTGS
jgi:UDP-glucuronate 4-epimerase